MQGSEVKVCLGCIERTGLEHTSQTWAIPADHCQAQGQHDRCARFPVAQPPVAAVHGAWGGPLACAHQPGRAVPQPDPGPGACTQRAWDLGACDRSLASSGWGGSAVCITHDRGHILRTPHTRRLSSKTPLTLPSPQAPRRKLGTYFSGWRGHVTLLRQRRAQAIEVLLHMEERIQRDQLHDMFRWAACLGRRPHPA